MERNNKQLQPQNGGKVTKIELNKLRNRLKNMNKAYVSELSEKTGFHKNTIHKVFNDNIGVRTSTRLTIISASVALLSNYSEDIAKLKNLINK